MCFGCRVGSHGSIMSKIKTFKRLRATRGGGFVARRVRNYNRRKSYGGTSVSCQTSAFPGGNVIINNNNCLKSNIQCIEIRVQWTVHLGSSHMHVHAVTRVHAVTPKLVICI